jgi:septum formation protein
LILVLASTSPRRYEILALLRLPFLMIPPDLIEEPLKSGTPEQEALHLAHLKAASLAGRVPRALQGGSATVIDFEGQTIGKPRNREDARRILSCLRGCAHEVITGLAILNPQSGTSFERIERVRVSMRGYSEAEIDAYEATEEPLDKAGAYSLQGQGRALLAGLDGDYLAAVGLPLKAVAEGLRRFHVPIDVDVDEIYRQRSFLNWRSYDP